MTRQLFLRFIRKYHTDKLKKSRQLSHEMHREDKKYSVINNGDLQVIGSSTFGFHPSLLVSSEGNSYLFNCYEGTQRFCNANAIKINNVQNVFLTNCSWDRLSGTIGLSLTLHELGVPKLAIHSTTRLEKLFEATRPFILGSNTDEPPLHTISDDYYEDSGIKVRKIPLDCDRISKARPESISLEQILKKPKSEPPRLLAYHCLLPDVAGTLDPKRCRELKIPIGPLLGQLKSGNSITLKDGTIITPEQVCGPKKGGASFLVLECPNESFVENLYRSELLEEIRQCRSTVLGDFRQIEIVIHFSPQELTNSSRYKEWLNGFAPDCKHIFMYNNDAKTILHEDIHRYQYLLNHLDADIFPRLYLPAHLEKIASEQIENQAKVETPKCEIDESDEAALKTTFKIIEYNDLDKIIKPESLFRIVFRPKKQAETVDTTKPLDYIVRTYEQKFSFIDTLKELRESQKNWPKPADHEPEIVFLGTGSAIPSKRRNVSCILVNFHHNNTSIMMDCGEDSYGQLYRLYGEERSNEILKQLKMIYISHQHTDHHLGLIQILRKRRSLTNKPVVLVLPPFLDNLLNFYSTNVEDLSSSYNLFATKTMRTRSTGQTLSIDAINEHKQALYDKMDGFLYSIDVVNVHHCINACAVNMKFRIGHPDMKDFSISYSGDCRPNENFTIIGRDCDVLIHEATFDQRSLEDAVFKRHSTSTEAIKVSKQMQAKYTILTHFSQRLPKIPYFTDLFDEKINYAFDNLSLRYPSQMTRLPKMQGIFSIAFEESLQEIDLGFWRKEQKQKLINEALKAL